MESRYSGWELKFCGIIVKLSTESTELSTGYLSVPVQNKSRRQVCLRPCFCAEKGLVLHQVDIYMVVGHGDAVLGEALADGFLEGTVDRPVVGILGPYADGVADGAVAVFAEQNDGGGIAEDQLVLIDGIHDGGADLGGGIVIGGRDRDMFSVSSLQVF